MDLTQSYLSMFSQHVKTGLILYSNSSQQCLNNGIIFKSTTIISHHSCHMILFAFFMHCLNVFCLVSDPLQ